MTKKQFAHACAIFSVIVWGSTFVSTKILLQAFTPLEILIFRFLIGYIALFIFTLHKHIKPKKSEEIMFFLAALSGIVLYFLFENIALTLTTASNVGIIIAIAPIFTTLFAAFFLKGEQLKVPFFIGMMLSLLGIIIMSIFNGSALSFHPVGDGLALLAAIFWAAYSILIKKIAAFGYPILQTTRRIFGYGLLSMLPCLLFFDFSPNLAALLSVKNSGNLLFLGLGASALCFLTWNYALDILGATKTSVYIYALPAITIILSWIFLNEIPTVQIIVGIVFVLFGLFIAESSHKDASIPKDKTLDGD
ncbi:amino acid exporter for phenylalanine [Erysipelotrichaceae bacterium]|nr:amino acid exporter for phenylalanine [Erysipelotrichaceae bacterium]